MFETNESFGDGFDIAAEQPVQVSLDAYSRTPSTPVDIAAIPARIAQAVAKQNQSFDISSQGQTMVLPEQNVSAWDTKTKILVALGALAVVGGAVYYSKKRKWA